MAAAARARSLTRVSWLPGMKIHESPIQRTSLALTCACGQPPSAAAPSVFAAPFPRWMTLSLQPDVAARATPRQAMRPTGPVRNTRQCYHRAMLPGGALLVALLFQNAIAAPSTAPEEGAVARARLEVHAGPACLSRRDLAWRVVARSPRIQFADDAAISARVSLTSSRPGNVVAELILDTAGAEQPPRRFVARSCAEAADAIAVIIAVTLDPTLKRPDSPPAASP